MTTIELRGTPEAIHAREVGGGRGASGAPVLWMCRPTVPAVVLGSAQRDVVVDHRELARRGAQLVRRRGGGGAVWVDSTVSWFDIEIGPKCRLWEDDVGKAFGWVGELLTEVLGSVGVEATAHEGPLVSCPWSRLVCFAGVGPGEVLVEGRKLVGISQRRTRTGARFMCQAHSSWRPGDLLDVIELDPTQRAQAASAVARAAVGLDDLDLASARFESAIADAIASL